MDTHPEPLNAAAADLFGIPYIFPYQRLVVSNILEGRDQIVILPTGAGKSLCFMLPSQLIDGITLVVFPLLSLMADQKRRLAESGISCGVLSGGQKRKERDDIWRECTRGDTRILLTNPETASSPTVMKRLQTAGVAHLVIDEAHTVSEWGETFRPAYLQLAALREALNRPVTTAFTATASPHILKRVRSIVFGDDDPHLVQAVPDRPNIRYSVLPVLSRYQAVRRLAARVERPAIVFCRSRTSTEMTARTLALQTGDPAVRFYHAGLEKDEKKRIEEWFFDSRDGILTSTSAYGMGVDKADIRTVIHREIPPSIESYLQESGRAGRDRSPASAVLLVSADDDLSLSRLQDPLARERFAAMLRYATNTSTCRREQLLAMLGSAPEACFGCDVCDGTARRRPHEEAAVLRSIRANSGRFTLTEIRALLRGASSVEAYETGLWRYPGFGTLRGWTDEEIGEALSTLRADGRIRVPTRGPWKHRTRADTAPAYVLRTIAMKRRGRRSPHTRAASAALLTSDERPPTSTNVS